MKVILLQDVAKIGRRADVVDVPHGYALNKLIPEGKAQQATPANLKQISSLKAKHAAANASDAATFKAAIETLKDKTVTISATANEQGHLFEQLKAEKIVAACQESGATILASQIQLETPIKEVGVHSIRLTDADITGTLTLEVTAA